jgi:RimJ/RimL family protein N-acetyltransferase
MQLQDHQAWTLSVLPVGYFEVLGKLGPAGSAEVDGRIIACAGIAEQGMGIGTLWAFVAQDAGRHFVRLDRCTRRLLTLISLRRIEATVEVGFSPGCRWLELLGFQFEGILRKYGQNGLDHWRYSRV